MLIKLTRTTGIEVIINLNQVICFYAAEKDLGSGPKKFTVLKYGPENEHSFHIEETVEQIYEKLKNGNKGMPWV